MKKIFLLMFAFCCIGAFPQQPLEYSVIIQKEGDDAQTLYDLTRNWFAQTYRDSKSVLQDQNPGKELTGHGKITFSTNVIYSSIQGFIKYLIDVQFKDGRLRFEMKNFTHEPLKDALYNNNMGILVDSLPKNLKDIGIEGSNRKASYKYFYKHGKTLCEKQFIQLSNSLKEFIEKREASNDDW